MAFNVVEFTPEIEEILPIFFFLFFRVNYIFGLQTMRCVTLWTSNFNF